MSTFVRTSSRSQFLESLNKYPRWECKPGTINSYIRMIKTRPISTNRPSQLSNYFRKSIFVRFFFCQIQRDLQLRWDYNFYRFVDSANIIWFDINSLYSTCRLHDYYCLENQICPNVAQFATQLAHVSARLYTNKIAYTSYELIFNDISEWNCDRTK